MRFAVVSVLIVSMLIGATPAQDDTLMMIDRQVRSRFYDPKVLKEVNWEARVLEAKRLIPFAQSEGERVQIYRELLASLHSSHTQYLTRKDPFFWYLAGSWERMLQRNCKGRIPEPLEWQEIGVEWVPDGTRWFVGGLFAGGPAEAAGLMLGDEVLTANGHPFHPVKAFEGQSGKSVKLSLRRSAGSAPLSMPVVPRTVSPQKAFAEAISRSAHVIERSKRRIGYVHIWSWGGDDLPDKVLNAIAELNKKNVDSFILDLRDGHGAASTRSISIFDSRVPVIESYDRNGESADRDAQIRVPAILLVNGRTQGAKEIVAFGAQRHRLAHLVGDRTAGAVLGGLPLCLPNGALLHLPVLSVRVDGVVLEGHGIEPDTKVPFDIRYAQGRDPQLEAGIAHLAPAP